MARLFKLAYYRTIPVKAAAGVVLSTILGAGLGAKLLVDAPEQWVHLVVIAIFIFTFFVEFKEWNTVKRGSSLLFAFFTGATSGFSGTSGPLKGVSLRNLNLDRFFILFCRGRLRRIIGRRHHQGSCLYQWIVF